MPNTSKIVVLIADDEPSTVAMLSSHLRSSGYAVLEASDGDQAWELAHEHLPHLVILDVMMPGMSGWEVCRKIREAVSLAHTGVIMLTGIGENLNEMTSPLYGADSYLDKPFEFSVLDERIAEALAARRHGAMGRPDESTAPERPSGPASPDVAVSKTKSVRPKAPKRAAKKAPKKKAKPAEPAKKAPKKKAKPVAAKMAKKKKGAATKKSTKPRGKPARAAKRAGKGKPKRQAKAKRGARA